MRIAPRRSRPEMIVLILLLLAGSTGSASAGNCIVDASSGFEHTIAIGVDGTLWAWGSGYAGKLGTGRGDRDEMIPVQVRDLTEAISVAAGEDHSLAVRNDGTVWVWGSRNHGAFGDGGPTFGSSDMPVPVPGFSSAVQVAAGAQHSLALLANGTVWAWGRGTEGQLGNGANVDALSPVPVPLPRILEIGAGSLHSYALDESGGVWTWGRNFRGQLGNGTTTDSSVPLQAQVPVPVASLGQGYGGHFTQAIDRAGVLWAWGGENQGELGVGRTSGSLVPVSYSYAGPVAEVRTGGRVGSALLADGSVYWFGTLPDGTREIVPRLRPEWSSVEVLSVGQDFQLAFDGLGYGWGWGICSVGQLGNGSLCPGAWFQAPTEVRRSWDWFGLDEQGNVIRAVRRGLDVEVTWPGALANQWRLYRDSRADQLGTNPLTPDPPAPFYLDARAPAPAFYYVRGLSNCTGEPGE